MATSLVSTGVQFPDATIQTTAKYALTSGTPVNTTSGTAFDFTGIPSWVKRITVSLASVSTNGTSNLILQLGSGSIETSGYTGYVARPYASGTIYTGFVPGFVLSEVTNAAIVRAGSVVLTLMGSNIWIANGASTDTVNSNGTGILCGTKTTAGTLDRIRITTVSGTDIFDGGAINILYD